MDEPAIHIVRVARNRSFSCDTLPVEYLARLEAAFRAGRWWRDRWADRAFRAEARRVMRECGGLVLLGPGVKFEIPPAFDEFFEAIEIATPFWERDGRLKTISGEAPTREERVGAVFKVIGIVIAVLLGLGFVLGFFLGFPFRAYRIIGLTLLGWTALVFLIVQLVRIRAHVYLVPGGLAVVRRPPRKGRPPRITVFSRDDSCMVFRLVSTGKTVVMMLELWTHAGRTVGRAVSQREAMSAVAVWKSGQKPLDDDRLVEVVRC